LFLETIIVISRLYLLQKNLLSLSIAINNFALYKKGALKRAPLGIKLIHSNGYRVKVEA
jgi:hypothetical protein